MGVEGAAAGLQDARDIRPGWHVDCIAVGMSDESYTALLLAAICLLAFACSVVAITQHPEWFGS